MYSNSHHDRRVVLLDLILGNRLGYMNKLKVERIVDCGLDIPYVNVIRQQLTLIKEHMKVNTKS